MKHILITLAFAAIVCSCTKPPQSVDGSIFIVTKGGESVKLGLVEVSVFDYDSLNSYIQDCIRQDSDSIARNMHRVVELVSKANAAKQHYDSIYAAWNDATYGTKSYNELYAASDLALEQQLEASLNAIRAMYFGRNAFEYNAALESNYSKLGHPKSKLKTDADGKFSLSLPEGKYAVCASAKRLVGEDTEYYDWMTFFEVKENTPNQVMLSNNNMGDDCETCLVGTKTLPALPELKH